MTTPPVYVRRFERVTQALRILTMHPDGLPVARLAEMLAVDESTLREELVAYFRAEIDPRYGEIAYRQIRIGFFGPREDGDEVEPAEASIVRAFTSQPTAEVGVAHVTIGQLARIYRAGRDLLAQEPGNTVLESALIGLGETTLGGVEPPESYGISDLTGTMRSAIEDQRRVTIRYAAAWGNQVRDYVLEPHRLISTRRGWEVDAGVRGSDGQVRVLTFLLAGIHAVDVHADAFARPADVDQQIAANRQERAVEVLVPQSARWAVDRLAESVEVLQEDEDAVKLRAHLLPPVGRRVGLMMLISGTDAFVVTPRELDDSARNLARELLRHHDRDV